MRGFLFFDPIHGRYGCILLKAFGYSCLEIVVRGGGLVFVGRARRCGGATMTGGYVVEKVIGGFVAGGGSCGRWTFCSGHGRDGRRLLRGWSFSRVAVFSLF